jgi:hypothetical protein
MSYTAHLFFIFKGLKSNKMNKNDISCSRFSDSKICPLNAIAKKIKTVKIRL